MWIVRAICSMRYALQIGFVYVLWESVSHITIENGQLD